MKILFFHRWVGVHGGGTETHLLELARRFSQRGHDVAILTRQGRRLQDLDKRIRVIRISRNPGESDHSYENLLVYLHTALFALKSLVRLLILHAHRERFDVISVHFATEALVARIFRWISKTPFLFVLEGYTPLEAKTAAAADARIAISDFEAAQYRDVHGVEAAVVHIGVDRARFGIEAAKAADLRAKFVSGKEILVLTVCRLEPRKDLSTLLRAAERLRETQPHIRFVIVGEGISGPALREELTRRNLGNCVRLAGYVDDEKLPFYYKAADIFVLTSREEWFGIVYIEAMAAGLPVIATNVDAAPEVLGDCGIFFERGNDASLAERIRELARDAQRRADRGRRSLVRAERFDWEKQATLYEAHYVRAASKGRNTKT